jgi:hypothetical protein
VFVIYKPEGQPEQRWHYQPGRIHSGEMILLERETGLRYGQEFKQELAQGSTVARRGLLWLFLHRAHPALKYADVGFYDDELELQLDKDEVAKEIEALEDMAGGMPESQRQAGLALMRAQLDSAPDAPGKAPAVDPTPADEPIPPTAPADALTPPQPPAPSAT